MLAKERCPGGCERVELRREIRSLDNEYDSECAIAAQYNQAAYVSAYSPRASIDAHIQAQAHWGWAGGILKRRNSLAEHLRNTDPCEDCPMYKKSPDSPSEE